AQAVAYLSADAIPDPDWVRHALAGLARADMVFGRQLHAPHRWSVPAAVRGLRYRFPDREVDDPWPWASNVALACRKQILESFPFDPAANAAEDLLLALRARQAGYSAVYEPRMLVRHGDVASFREEWSKMRREGFGWAQHRRELGLQKEVLAWGGAVAACLALAAFRPAVGLPLAGAAVYAPAARRALAHPHRVPPRQAVKGVLASPVFDLGYLAHYLRGLVRPAKAAPAATAAAARKRAAAPAAAAVAGAASRRDDPAAADPSPSGAPAALASGATPAATK
ncbi:MAG TPA: glycosyltransferase family 2 protein, partial [Candidatus Thermoplasmatota archaeon]|nr:glycosyltransferase family 2 protein [Candidatus Thermoplasmatota archaeon]